MRRKKMNSYFNETTRRLWIMASAMCLVVAFAVPIQGETLDTSIGEIGYEAGYPKQATVEKLYDELDFQRAVQAYLWALPMASYGAMADAHWALGADSHTVIVADKLAEPRQLALTANQDTVYMSGVLDLREGPMVMELPPGLLGTMNNIWQQPLVDLGGPFSPGYDEQYLAATSGRPRRPLLARAESRGEVPDSAARV
jgi:hypothetical protein